MLRRPNFRSLRGRLFVALFLTAALPAGFLLVGGAWLVREGVMLTGSAGPWGSVAASGQALLESIEAEPAATDTLQALARVHRELLSESLRLSRLYAWVGERVLVLLPLLAGGLFLVVAGVSLWSAKQVSRALSRPVRELEGWIERLGRGEPLPVGDATREAREIREVRTLRTGLRRMSSELARARDRDVREARNRSWSEMARRIAHDLKNPLTPMQMAARTAARSPDPAAAEAGQVLLEEIARLEELSRSFAQFGRPPEGPPSVVEMGELLRHLHRRVDPTGTRVSLHVEAEDAFVLGHPVALERVVRNLVANALDAQEAVGSLAPVELRLAAGETARGPGSETAAPGETGEHPEEELRIEVLDRGPGLSDLVLERVWEPDFTTKRRGTGLGLPLVRQVVEAHDGRVEGGNRPGGGARFAVILPRATLPSERSSALPSAGEGRA